MSDNRLVGYCGEIEDISCSSIKRTVLFLCSPDGTQISARVVCSRVLFIFQDKTINVSSLDEGQIIDVSTAKVEADIINDNYVTLLPVTDDRYGNEAEK